MCVEYSYFGSGCEFCCKLYGCVFIFKFVIEELKKIFWYNFNEYGILYEVCMYFDINGLKKKIF